MKHVTIWLDSVREDLRCTEINKVDNNLVIECEDGHAVFSLAKISGYRVRDVGAVQEVCCWDCGQDNDWLECKDITSGVCPLCGKYAGLWEWKKK